MIDKINISEISTLYKNPKLPKKDELLDDNSKVSSKYKFLEQKDEAVKILVEDMDFDASMSTMALGEEGGNNSIKPFLPIEDEVPPENKKPLSVIEKPSNSITTMALGEEGGNNYNIFNRQNILKQTANNFNEVSDEQSSTKNNDVTLLNYQEVFEKYLQENNLSRLDFLNKAGLDNKATQQEIINALRKLL